MKFMCIPKFLCGLFSQQLHIWSLVMSPTVAYFPYSGVESDALDRFSSPNALRNRSQIVRDPHGSYRSGKLAPDRPLGVITRRGLIGQLIFKEATWPPFTQKSYLTARPKKAFIISRSCIMGRNFIIYHTIFTLLTTHSVLPSGRRLHIRLLL